MLITNAKPCQNCEECTAAAHLPVKGGHELIIFLYSTCTSKLCTFPLFPYVIFSICVLSVTPFPFCCLHKWISYTCPCNCSSISCTCTSNLCTFLRRSITLYSLYMCTFLLLLSHAVVCTNGFHGKCIEVWCIIHQTITNIYLCRFVLSLDYSMHCIIYCQRQNDSLND